LRFILSAVYDVYLCIPKHDEVEVLVL
jgi:hypothetical protein